MSTAFSKISTGLNEAISHAKGDARAARVIAPEDLDVAKIRLGLKMTQPEFAARFGFSVATLRHWERGDRTPSGSARVLLTVVARAPKAVLAAL
jgi:putative transcriptional regulator